MGDLSSAERAIERAPSPVVESLPRRWELVAQHRQEMLRIARRRVETTEDAEDVVSTAIVRTVQHVGLDEDRIAPFLATTVKRLCVDVHRDRSRQLALGMRDAGRAAAAAPVDERVCDQDEARWLARALRDAPERERQVLAARMAGMSAKEISRQLAITPKAAENAYTRLRHRAAALLSSTLAGAAATLGLTRPATRPALVGVPVAALSVMAAALMVLPHQTTQAPPEQAPSVQQTTQAAADTVPPPPAPLPRAGEAQTLPRGDAPAPPPARVRHPAPERTEIRPPAIVDPRVVSVGGAYVEKRHEEESFAESVQRCINGIDLTDPTSDPCR